jgi:hypothetical protein
VQGVEVDKGSLSGEEAGFNRFNAPVTEVREPSTLENTSVRTIRNTHSLAKIIIVPAFVESSFAQMSTAQVCDLVNTLVKLKVAYL